MAPSTTTRSQARTGTYTRTPPSFEVTESTRRQRSEPSTQPRANLSTTMATSNVESLTQPAGEEIAQNNCGTMNPSSQSESEFGNFTSQRRLLSRVSRQNRRSDDASEDLVHLGPNKNGNMTPSRELGSEFENFTQRRLQSRVRRRSENLSNLSVDLDDLEPITTGDLDNFIKEANKDKLANYGLPSPPATPAREQSLEPEMTSTQQNSVPVSPLSPQTQDDNILSDVDADLDDLVFTDDHEEREQLFNMVDEAQRMAENPNYVPLGMTTETENEDPSRSALEQISHQSNRLQEEANRPRPSFPNHLMDEYLEDASNFGRAANRQTFSERHRENIRARTGPQATTTTATTNNSNIDCSDSWIDLEPLRETLPTQTQDAPLGPATRQQASVGQGSLHLFPNQRTIVFRSFR
ncbi:hypothetical protein DL98DRAFT_598184 [Cadophora sp. DSE1049]|nr:hypothetical protein DL98DRAFT_598184 [Cadophora sp. DSE1049]